MHTCRQILSLRTISCKTVACGYRHGSRIFVRFPHKRLPKIVFLLGAAQTYFDQIEHGEDFVHEVANQNLCVCVPIKPFLAFVKW